MKKKNLGQVWKVWICFFMSLTMVPMGKMNVAAAEDVYTYKIHCTDEGSNINQVTYSGWWSKDATESWTNATKWDSANLPSFEAKFSGNRVAIIGQRDPALGIYKVQIDDLPAEEIDAYASSRVNNVQIYEKTGLEEGEHTLKFYVQNKRNPLGSGNLGAQFVELEIGSSIEDPNRVYETFVNDFDTGSDFFQIQYNGKWGTSTGYTDRFYNGDEHWFNFSSSYTAGDPMPSYSMKFIGSGFELIGEKQPGLGIFNVYLDDVLLGSVDAYNASVMQKVTLFSKSDIVYGEHTLKVELTNTKNSASKGMDGELDGIRISHKKIPTTAISFDSSSLQVEKDDSIQLTATALPSYATDPKLTYISSDPSIATVDADGKVTGVKEGKATITVSETASKVTNSLEVTVLPQGLPLEAFIGSTDVHHQQKDYADYVGGGNEFYDSVAWKGDTLNSKLVVLTKNKAVHNMEVIASDFKSDAGDIIGKGNVEITWLKDVEANMGRGQLATAPNELFPDVLYTSDPIDADSKKVNSAWVNFNVPKDAKPGIYKGTLSVSADEMDTPITFDYEYEVLDLELPDVKEMDTQLELWQHPFVSARYYGISNLNDINNPNWFNEEHSAYLTSMMEEYASIGGRGVVATIVEEAWNHQSYDNDPSMVKWTKNIDGTFSYDYTLFDKWIQLNIDAGVIDPTTGYGQIKSYSIVPWNNQVTYYDEATSKTVKVSLTPGSAEWNNVWTSLLNDYIEHVDAKGWLDITYISMDERPISQLEPAVNLIKSITSDSGKTFKISSAMNFDAISDYTFLDKIDDISIGISHIKQNDAVKNLADHRTEKGLLTTVYNCVGEAPNSNTIAMPVESEWILWYSMNQHLSGYMRWSYDGWTEKPLENVFYKYWEAGDPFFIYPGDKGTDTHFRSSPRFERLKEGVRDINKAKYLSTLSDENKVAVDELVESLERPAQGTNSWGATLLPSQADKDLVINETRRMKDGINTIAKDYLARLPIDISDIDVDTDTVSIYEGEEAEVIATAIPADASDPTLYWWSEDETIATVNNGTIKGVKAGTTTVYVSTVDGKTRQVAITKEIKVTVLAAEEVVDKSALQVLVDSTGTLDEAVYTPNSYEALQTALDDAQAVLDNADATQAEVDAAVTDLQAAIDALVTKADKSVLDTLIADADTKVEEAYTAESWAAFESAVADAKTISADENATQEQVNSAAEALSAAMNALETVQEETVNTDALQQLISEIEALNAKDYTVDSWKALQEVLADAKATLLDPEASQADIDAQVKALQVAKDKLVKQVTIIEKPSTAPTAPAVSGNGGSTNTGDTTNVNFLYAMLLFSGVVVVRRYWKKKVQG